MSQITGIVFAVIFIYTIKKLILYLSKEHSLKKSPPYVKKRLLVIDDDPTVLFAIRKLLMNRDVEIDTSESFDEAMNFIDHHHYQLIITDLGFSDQVDNAGLAISHYARKKIPDVSIVLWTARDISELSDKIQNAEINLCLSKPIAPNVIYTIVDKMSDIKDAL